MSDGSGLRLAGASKLRAAFIVLAGLALLLHSGALPLVTAAQAQRAADLYVYLGQHHGPLDALELGQLALSGAW